MSIVMLCIAIIVALLVVAVKVLHVPLVQKLKDLGVKLLDWLKSKISQ